MKIKALILFLLLSISAIAQDWTISVVPTNIAVNSLVFEAEHKGLVFSAGIPVKFSLTDPVERFAIQRSDYDKANMGIASILFGVKKYAGNFYVMPYAVGRWIDLDFHINRKIGWPVNSDLLTDVANFGGGLSFGYKINRGKFILNFFAGPEIGMMYFISRSKSFDMADADWMHNYYFPHEYFEMTPKRMSETLFLHRDGYDVLAYIRGRYYSLRAGFGIGFRL